MQGIEWSDLRCCQQSRKDEGSKCFPEKKGMCAQRSNRKVSNVVCVRHPPKQSCIVLIKLKLGHRPGPALSPCMTVLTPSCIMTNKTAVLLKIYFFDRSDLSCETTWVKGRLINRNQARSWDSVILVKYISINVTVKTCRTWKKVKWMSVGVFVREKHPCWLRDTMLAILMAVHRTALQCVYIKRKIRILTRKL